MVSKSRGTALGTATPLPQTSQLWEALSGICQRRGVNLYESVVRWSERQRALVQRNNADYEYQTLLRAGCDPVPIAIAIQALVTFPDVASEWRRVVGPPRKRDQFVRKLRDAADVLEGLARAAGLNGEQGFWPPQLGASPHVTVAALRQYAAALGAFQSAARDMELRSPRDLPRYLFTGYVFRASGRWHDDEVSIIIQAAEQGEVYDANAHKMWRTRNYARLNKHYHGLAELLCAVPTVVSPGRK